MSVLVFPSGSSLESAPMLESPNPLSPQDSYVELTLVNAEQNKMRYTAEIKLVNQKDLTKAEVDVIKPSEIR